MTGDKTYEYFGKEDYSSIDAFIMGGYKDFTEKRMPMFMTERSQHLLSHPQTRPSLFLKTSPTSEQRQVDTLKAGVLGLLVVSCVYGMYKVARRMRGAEHTYKDI